MLLICVSAEIDRGGSIRCRSIATTSIRTWVHELPPVCCCVTLVLLLLLLAPAASLKLAVLIGLGR